MLYRNINRKKQLKKTGIRMGYGGKGERSKRSIKINDNQCAVYSINRMQIKLPNKNQEKLQKQASISDNN
jgi:hypothetical protein